jgi:hypothetical protein
MRWAGHTLERRAKCTRFWWKSTKEKDCLEDRGVDGRMGFKWILQILAVEWIHWAQDNNRMVGFCEYGDEPLGVGSLISYKSKFAMLD